MDSGRKLARLRRQRLRRRSGVSASSASSSELVLCTHSSDVDRRLGRSLHGEHGTTSSPARFSLGLSAHFNSRGHEGPRPLISQTREAAPPNRASGDLHHTTSMVQSLQLSASTQNLPTCVHAPELSGGCFCWFGFEDEGTGFCPDFMSLLVPHPPTSNFIPQANYCLAVQLKPFSNRQCLKKNHLPNFFYFKSTRDCPLTKK